MKRLIIGGLTSLALVAAPTIAAAQQVPAPAPTYEQGAQLSDDECDDDDEKCKGILWWLVGGAIALIIIYFAFIKDDDDNEPESP